MSSLQPVNTNNSNALNPPPSSAAPPHPSTVPADAYNVLGQQPPPPPLHPQHMEPRHRAQLQDFWRRQLLDVERVNDFKNHQLPLARIKKIMKSDEDVRMISAEAPVLFAKACEMFILELTLRSWIHSEENKRRTLQRNDIAAAITKTDIFDFLVDIVPRDELKTLQEGMQGVPRSVSSGSGPAGGGGGGGLPGLHPEAMGPPYGYYVQQGQPMTNYVPPPFGLMQPNPNYHPNPVAEHGGEAGGG